MPTYSFGERAIQGREENGVTTAEVGVTENDLHVAIHSPLSGFGETLVVEPTPRVQIDAVYGVIDSDHETFSAGSGSITVADSMFVADCGTGVGSYGTIRSLRAGLHRSGQSLLCRISAEFEAGVANYLSGAGLFNAVDGLWVGYNDTEFGFTRRVDGASEIQRLLVTGAPSSSGNITITLNGVATVVAILSTDTTIDVARKIAAAVFTGWNTHPNDSNVTFVASGAGDRSGTYSFADTGATGATATITQLHAGADTDHDTYFVPKSSWNYDKFDGSGPSGVTLDPSKLNIYQIIFPYLGTGPISLWIMSPLSGRFTLAHRISYPNAFSVPSQRNPSLRVGWFSASLGSTTSIAVRGPGAAIFNSGRYAPLRDPVGYGRTATGVSTTVQLLSIRNRREFRNSVNQREITMQGLEVGVEGNKPATITVLKNATIVGSYNWAYVDQNYSCAEYEGTNGLTVTGGRRVGGTSAAGSGSSYIDLSHIRLAPGETITVVGTITGGAGSNIACSISWLED